MADLAAAASFKESANMLGDGSVVVDLLARRKADLGDILHHPFAGVC